MEEKAVVLFSVVCEETFSEIVKLQASQNPSGIVIPLYNNVTVSKENKSIKINNSTTESSGIDQSEVLILCSSVPLDTQSSYVFQYRADICWIIVFLGCSIVV